MQQMLGHGAVSTPRIAWNLELLWLSFAHVMCFSALLASVMWLKWSF